MFGTIMKLGFEQYKWQTNYHNMDIGLFGLKPNSVKDFSHSSSHVACAIARYSILAEN